MYRFSLFSHHPAIGVPRVPLMTMEILHFPMVFPQVFPWFSYRLPWEATTGRSTSHLPVDTAMQQEAIYWRYLPYIRPIFEAYVREYHHKIWPKIWYSTSILGSWNSHWQDSVQLPEKSGWILWFMVDITWVHGGKKWVIPSGKHTKNYGTPTMFNR